MLKLHKYWVYTVYSLEAILYFFYLYLFIFFFFFFFFLIVGSTLVKDEYAPKRLNILRFGAKSESSSFWVGILPLPVTRVNGKLNEGQGIGYAIRSHNSYFFALFLIENRSNFMSC